jgi:hypothetical protein
MRKLCLLAAVVAGLAVTGSALAASVTLTGPTSITVGKSVSFTGVLSGFTSPKTVSLSQFAGGSCAAPGTAAGSASVPAPAVDGSYSISYTAGGALAGQTVSFRASTVSGTGRTLNSNCVSAKVVAAASNEVVALPSHAFLCYSSFQGAPTTSSGWTTDVAAKLVAQGYWQPFAVAGSDSSSGAVNVGGYHLACNVAGAQSGPGGYVDNDGSAMPSLVANVIGIYPVAG